MLFISAYPNLDQNSITPILSSLVQNIILIQGEC